MSIYDEESTHLGEITMSEITSTEAENVLVAVLAVLKLGTHAVVVRPIANGDGDDPGVAFAAVAN